MFYNLCTLIILLATFSGWGSIAALLAGFRTEKFSLKAINGMLLLTVVLVILAFIFPLSFWIEILLVSVGIGAFFYFKNYLDLYRLRPKLLVLILGVIATFAGSFAPFILDHFGYYVPTISWLKTAGLVKGIANLDLILGQMSFWHILCAGFSHFSDPFLRINTVVFFVYAIYAVERGRFFHFLMWPVLILFVQTPSPDLPVIVFSLIVLDEFLHGNRHIVWLFAVSAFIFAIKPTVMWPLMLIFFAKFSFRSWCYFLPGALIFLLFIFKNYWCFGYPVFPVAFGDIGLPWIPNPQLMANSAEMSIMKTYDLQYSTGEIKHFGFADYIINWITLSGMKSLVNMAFIITLLALLVFAAIKKSKFIWLIVAAIFIKSFVILMTSAQYRFLLDVFFAAAFLFFAQKFNSKKMISAGITLTCIGLMLLGTPNLIQKAVPSFRLGFFMKNFEKEQLIKPSDYKLTKYKTYNIGNLRFNTPDHYPLSFKTPSPSISPYFINSYLNAGIFPQYSDKKKTAFIWKKINSEEKQKIRQILTEIGYLPTKQP